MKDHYPNFDWLRLALAIEVVAIHTIPIGHVLINPVAGFLAISGFVVLGSMNRRPLRDFFVSRFLRVLPLLIVSFAAVGLLFGWNEMIHTISFWIWPSGPVPINGAVWTLIFEEAFYALLAVLFSLGVYKRAAGPCLILVIVAGLATTRTYLFLVAPWYILGAAFFIGNVVYIFRQQVKRISQTAATIVFIIAMVGILQLPHMAFVVLPYVWAHILSFAAMLIFAIAGPQLPRLKIDLSYSLYLLHLIVRYFVAKYIPLGYGQFFATLACTLPICYLAWHFIEVPALRFKPRQQQAIHPDEIASTVKA